MRARRLAPACAALIMLLLPAVAAACEVCFSGSPRIRWAFLNTTIFLSFLPLGLLGVGVFWLRGKGKNWLEDEFLDRDEER